MKKPSVLLLLTVLAAGAAMADEPAWLVNLPQAVAQAKLDRKLVLIDFTGSDWCGWCKKLDADTFSQPAFLDFARKNLVLVQADFPAHKPQPDDLKEANHALAATYGVQGYPTLILLRADGSMVWKQTGYLPGGPDALIAKITGAPSAPAPTAPTPPPKPSAPAIYTQPPPNPDGEPRLQAILFSSHPSVMLEGKNCEEGDSVSGMKVVKIERDRVTVLWKGQTKELRLKGS